jgi:cytidylate kinase
LAARGAELSLDTIMEDLRRRDALDKRNTLVPADAIILQNEGMTPEQEVVQIIDSFERNLPRGAASTANSDAPPSRQ